MREALAVVAEEGLPSMWARHEACHHQLWDGLRSMGLKPFVESEADRLITINTIKVGHFVEALPDHCYSTTRGRLHE